MAAAASGAKLACLTSSHQARPTTEIRPPGGPRLNSVERQAPRPQTFAGLIMIISRAIMMGAGRLSTTLPGGLTGILRNGMMGRPPLLPEQLRATPA